MARGKSRRRLSKDQDEVLTLFQRALEVLKVFRKWILLGVVGLALLVAGWEVKVYFAGKRNEEAATALTRVRAKLNRPEEAAAAVSALEQVVQKYGGTPAGREAALFRAHLLYQMHNYGEAAQAYRELQAGPAGRDPGWDYLIDESLSYCYEAQGDYDQAAQVLQAAADKAPGFYKRELMLRLAWMLEKAGKAKEAAPYWQRLLEAPPNPALVPYLKEKVAALDAAKKK
ncbi:MAG: tetratricopeptide repeat protein [Thermodesulfobacteriota bacterium]